MAEAHNDEADELEDPIKVRWTGVARDKITGRNQDFAHGGENQKAIHVRDALTRQKTNVVIKTVAEAKAMITEMESYENGAGAEGRVWMNGPAANACNRVKTEIISEMEKQGYKASTSKSGWVKGFVQVTDSDDAEESDESEEADENELAKIDIDELTSPEINEVIPSRPYVVVGYTSNRTDRVLEQALQNPNVSNGYHLHQVHGDITGHDPEDEGRGIGFSKGGLKASSSHLGKPVYVKIPDYTEIKKVDHTVRFTMEDGNYSTAVDDGGVIEGVTETYSYDFNPYDLDLSNAEAFRWEKHEDNYVKRARFDLVVPITLPASLDDEDVIDAAEELLPDPCLWEEDVPEIGNHIEEVPMERGGMNNNHRKRRVITDVTIEEPEIMTDGGTVADQRAEVDTDYPLPVDEQTPLNEPVKIRLNQQQESHIRLLHSLGASYDDASESEPLIGAAKRSLLRQKTQAVVQTREEAESLHYELQEYLHPYGIPAPHGTERTFRRVLDTLEEKLQKQGYQIDTDSYRPEIVEADQ